MDESDNQPSAPGGAGYWFTPVPVYLIEASFDPKSPVNGPAVMLWAHIHRNYAWRRRVFPSHGTLARETDQSDSAIRRQLNALREVGAITWGAKYTQRGRSSNDYALALQRPFDFDREIDAGVTVKNDGHPPVTVTNDGGVEVKSDRHPTVKNERVVEEHRVSKRSPASQPPQQPPESAETQPAAEERTPQQVADELTKAFWSVHGKTRTQPYVSVLKIVRAAIGNGVPRDDLARALDQVARTGSIAAWKLDNALADLHTSRGGARTVTQTTEPSKTGLNL